MTTTYNECQIWECSDPSVLWYILMMVSVISPLLVCIFTFSLRPKTNVITKADATGYYLMPDVQYIILCYATGYMCLAILVVLVVSKNEEAFKQSYFSFDDIIDLIQ